MTSTAIADLQTAVAGLPDSLRTHIEGVVAEAVRLARRYDIEEQRVALAAWGHDIARAMRPDELLAYATEFGLAVEMVEEAAAPVLLHGPVGAELLRRRYSVNDEEVLAAVRFHTYGRIDMSALEKVLFVADKIEVSRARAIGDMAAVRALAETGDLDSAILGYLDQQTVEHVRLGRPLHPLAVATRNHLLLARRSSEG